MYFELIFYISGSTNTHFQKEDVWWTSIKKIDFSQILTNKFFSLLEIFLQNKRLVVAQILKLKD